MGEESQGGDGVSMDLMGKGTNAVLQIHTVPKEEAFLSPRAVAIQA